MTTTTTCRHGSPTLPDGGCRECAENADIHALNNTQRARYDEAINCGATHNDAMEAALYY